MKKKTFIVVCLVLFGMLSNAQENRQWIEDLDYYKNTLEAKHIDLFHTISKEEFYTEVEALKAKVPNLTDFQIISELMRITQSIGDGKGDGHTAVPLWNRTLHKFPIQLFEFDGDIRVISISKEHKSFLGNELKSIDGIAIEDIYANVSKRTPFTENKQSLMDRTCRYMVVSELLNALNVTKRIEDAQFTFADDDGNETAVVLKAYSKNELASLDYETHTLIHKSNIKPENSQLENLWFTSLNDSKTIYINFKTYPSEEEMTTFSEGAYQFIQDHKSEHLIIDLRDNYGGDLYKGLILSSWLNLCDSIDWTSKVYVLINRKTYSAAMVNALQYKQLLHAKIVGEPSGANPNGYQDLGEFTLPNSKVLITYTKRLFQLQESHTEGIQPDVLIAPNWDTYKMGFDEVLNWVLEDLKDLKDY